MKWGSVRFSMVDTVPRSSGIRRSGNTWTPSIAVASTSHHCRRRKWNDEPAAAPPVLGLLSHDLLGKVPAQEQHVVRHGLEQPPWRYDGDVHPREIASLLVGVPVSHEFERLPTDTDVVQKGGTLGGGAVGGDAPAGLLEFGQQAGELCFERLHSPGKIDQRFLPIHTPGSFVFQQPVYRVPGLSRQRDEEAKRTAVDGNALDLPELKAKAPDQPVECRDREVAKVLMIDRIELCAPDQVPEVRHL